MSRAANSDYQFISSDIDEIMSELITQYELMTERTVLPSSPERLFIAWIAGTITELRAQINYSGNQNIPSRAEGENLDALGELFFDEGRPEANAATVMMRFYISEAQDSAILIPAGTRVSTSDGDPMFETMKDVYVKIGDTFVDVRCECQETGTIGNGYTPGQINTLIDVDNCLYYDHCENIDDSAGGTDEATDDEYYDLMVSGEDAYSCAGARGAYEYWAKTVSTSIADVVVNSPSPGQINIYALMDDGSIAGKEIKEAILETCDEDSVRPLTDYVVVADPVEVPYDIKLTYYISEDSQHSASEIEEAVQQAVSDYSIWQSERMGRDINPSKLIAMLIEAGAKRVEVTSPTFTHLDDGRQSITRGPDGYLHEDVKPPQIAKLGETDVKNGGYEDE